MWNESLTFKVNGSSEGVTGLSYIDSENYYSCNNIISNKPRLSLKDSRTKIKKLREKLYNLTEEERIKEQENLLPVPLNKMNEKKYKLLKMHNLKNKEIHKYKECTKSKSLLLI